MVTGEERGSAVLGFAQAGSSRIARGAAGRVAPQGLGSGLHCTVQGGAAQRAARKEAL